MNGRDLIETFFGTSCTSVCPLSLKAEFEEQKEAELDDQRRGFSSEQEQKECSYTEKMSQLSAQLQQLDTVVSQVLHTHTRARTFFHTCIHTST